MPLQQKEIGKVFDQFGIAGVYKTNKKGRIDFGRLYRNVKKPIRTDRSACG